MNPDARQFVDRLAVVAEQVETVEQELTSLIAAVQQISRSPALRERAARAKETMDHVAEELTGG